jgi:hypothetical protein
MEGEGGEVAGVMEAVADGEAAERAAAENSHFSSKNPSFTYQTGSMLDA